MKEKQNLKLCSALKAIQQHVSMGVHQPTFGKQSFDFVSQLWNPDVNECERMTCSTADTPRSLSILQKINSSSSKDSRVTLAARWTWEMRLSNCQSSLASPLPATLVCQVCHGLPHAKMIFVNGMLSIRQVKWSKLRKAMRKGWPQYL